MRARNANSTTRPRAGAAPPTGPLAQHRERPVPLPRTRTLPRMGRVGPLPVRKLIVCNLLSLDGCFSGPDGNVLAMPFGPGFSDYNAERLREADTLLLGRRTFEMFHAHWPRVAEDPQQPALEREIARRNTTMPKVVVSDRLQPEATGGWGAVRIVRRAEAHAAIAALVATPGRDILVFGSRVLWNDLLAAGLVDELHFLIGAGVVGDGVRAFAARPAGSLRLLETRTFAGSSLLLARYAVER